MENEPKIDEELIRRIWADVRERKYLKHHQMMDRGFGCEDQMPNHPKKGCRCGSCKQDAYEASDAVDHVEGWGAWRIGKKRQSILRDNENQLPNNSDPDDKQAA